MSNFNFLGAFEEGIEASRRAEAARTEIEQIIDSLSRQLNEATSGRLKIDVIESQDILASFAKWNSVFAGHGLQNSKPQKSEWIGAKNLQAENDSYVKLAKWDRPHAGYPCTLTFNGRDLRCHDRDSLEESLAELLRDSLVGEALRQLLQRTPKRTIGPGDQAASDS